MPLRVLQNQWSPISWALLSVSDLQQSQEERTRHTKLGYRVPPTCVGAWTNCLVFISFASLLQASASSCFSKSSFTSFLANSACRVASLALRSSSIICKRRAKHGASISKKLQHTHLPSEQPLITYSYQCHLPSYQKLASHWYFSADHARITPSFHQPLSIFIPLPTHSNIPSSLYSLTWSLHISVTRDAMSLSLCSSCDSKS